MPVAGQALACIQVAANSSWRSYGDGMLALPMSPLDFALTSFDDDVPGYGMTPDQGYATYQLNNSSTGEFSTSFSDQDNGDQIDVSQPETPSSLLPFDIINDSVHEQHETMQDSNEDGKGADTATTMSSSIFSAELVNLDEVGQVTNIPRRGLACLHGRECISPNSQTPQILDLDKDSRTERATTVYSEDDYSSDTPEAVYSAASLFGLKEFLVQTVPKSKASQVATLIRELESVFGPPSVSPPDRYSERPRASLEDDVHEQKWCDGK